MATHTKAPAATQRPAVRNEPRFHTIVAVDVEKSSSRTDVLFAAMRRDLWRMLGDTLGRQGLDIGELTTIDDGDGFRVLLPAGVPPHAALDPFIGRLGIELRMHRAASSEANRIRLRVAVHSGLLTGEPGGTYTGVPLKDCARLLDAPAGRDLLAECPEADLVLLVSESFHRDVVAGGGSLDPALFRRIPIRVKETDRHGWAYLPAGPAPAGEPRAGRPVVRISAVYIRVEGGYWRTTGSPKAVRVLRWVLVFESRLAQAMRRLTTSFRSSEMSRG